jgi:hypothetical protein
MTDVYQPTTDTAPEAPAETVTLESKAEWQQEAIKQGVPLDIDQPFSPAEVAELANTKTSGRDHLLAKEMSRDLNRQREREGRRTLADMGDGRFYDQAAPVVEVKAPRGVDSWKSAEALTKDTTFNRRLSVMKEALDAGHDQQTAEAIAMKDGQFEPTIPTLANDKGEIISHLGRSMEAGDTTFNNVYEATRALRNGREAVQAQLQADLAEYQQTSTEQQIQPEAAPAPTPRPQGPSPEILAQQNALQQRQNALANQAAWLQLNTEERSLVAKNQQWDRWLNSVPEARSWEAWHATRENHPQRFAQIVKGFEQARNAKAAISRRAGELTKIRQHDAMQRQAHQEAQLTARNDAWDSAANEYLKKTMPEWTTDRAAVRRAVKAHLLSTGMTEQQIDHEWRYGDKLRTPEAQVTIAQAAKLRMMQERATPQALAARRKNNAPQPQAPGAWMPSSNDYSADLAASNRKLEGLSGAAALREAMRGTQIRRKAGLLSG